MAYREGGCACGQLRFKAQDDPIIVHCCHCSSCQRESGSAFALNYLIESDRVEWTGTQEKVLTPSASGRGQMIVRCPACHTAVSSHYSAGGVSQFLRVGAMDDKGGIAPDAHIFTSTRQAWVPEDPHAPSFAEFYDPKTFWSEDQKARMKALRDKA